MWANAQTMINGKALENNRPLENLLAQNRRHSCNSPDVGLPAEHPKTAGSTVMSGDNLEGVVRVPDRNRLSLHVNRCRPRGVRKERNENEMVQCAVLLPLCPEATTSKGSCFMILCKACAEKYSCFMCLCGFKESSTSSIEKDISGQGNSVVCESFSENQSPGFAKERSCTAFGVRPEGVIQNICEENEDNLQSSLKSPDDCRLLTEKSEAKSEKRPALDSSSKEIESTASVQEKVNVNSEEVKLCCGKGHILLTESEAEVPVKKILFSCAKSGGFLNDEENSISVICRSVRKPCIASLAHEFSADDEKTNQFLAGDFFEASNRLKRLEAHFKGFVCTKKQIASQENLKEISYTPKYLEEGLCFQENENPLCPKNCRSSHRLTSGIDPLRFNAVNNPPHFYPVSVKEDNTNVKICHNISLDENFNKGLLKASENIGELSKVKSIHANYNKQGSFQVNELQSNSVGLNKDEPFEYDSHLNAKYPSEYVSLFNLQFESPCLLKSEFDVRFLHNFNEVEHALECYDEFGLENFEYCSEDEFDLSSYCSLDEVVPFNSGSSQLTMRELNGPLRGLLKKPNRPAQARKNRVVFDETRNEFFEADYIILIREDCAYDEEDEEPCTCGEHELIRLCCEEGCQCNYNEENITPQVNSPKYAPPIEFVDEAALSPPEGYKDNGLKNTLTGALSGHVFGAQHIQQLQVIQRLQQQRAAMLAARASTQQSHTNQQQQPQQQQTVQVPETVEEDQQTVCTECAECVECAAKQIQEAECISGQCQEELSQLSVPAMTIIPLHNSSPERRITQKEIIAGEERPKYLLANQLKGPPEEETEKILSAHKNQRYVVETITMTTVTERRIVREATEDITTVATGYAPSESAELSTEQQATQSPKSDNIPSPAQINGILKGGKLWKHEQSQLEEPSNITAEDEANLKRSVRFLTEGNKEISREGDGQAQTENAETDNPINELIPFKKHSTLFNNALRPNSAVRQLFPSIVHPPPTAAVLTHEALRAFDESKRGNTLVSNLLSATSETDTIRRTIERNALRRSLIKKKTAKTDISLEDRIKQLTCDIDESTDEAALSSSDGAEKQFDYAETERRDSPAGEENPHQVKYIPDKSFSPSSSASSSSSGSTSAYKKISDIFSRDKRQEKIPETDENPIVIIPQECRCPAAPDLGMGVQVPAAHTQIHQTPPRQTEPRRQFLSTLAPLTACVAGQKDDLSYYTLATGERNSTASAQCSEYSLGDIESALFNNDARKVAPDVIAGTPGQEQDELVTFANQEASRTDKIKKRYTNESSTVQSNPSSDDDEQNDYGFNKRPSVRGIKPKFSSTNEILQQMQAQLSQPITPQQHVNKTFSLPKQSPNPATTLQQSSQTTGITQQQSERAWGFYAEADQRISGEHFNQQAGYYQPVPGAIKHTYHGHEESLMYQNCHSVTMEQHYRKFARSPTRRPESPPPLRNCHQTMVLIPYNTESYAQFSSNDPKATHQFSRQNILEYQQVTQQTIRVPISYTLPGMQLHVVAGRGTQPQYQHNPRLMAPRIYNFQQDPNFAERGVPEGAATASHTECKNLMSPTSSQANQQNCTQASTITTSVPGAVFYAMNV